MKKYLIQTIYKLAARIADSDTKNIRRELNRRALQSTVDYVSKNMSLVASVGTKKQVHDTAISRICINDGIILEFGVYIGETINYIASKLPTYEVFGFDSFEGLPEFWRDGFDKGRFSVENLPKVERNVSLIKGWFDHTLPIFLENEKRRIAYLHIDSDLYSSAKCILTNLTQRITPGTVIVFDEYFNYPGWEQGEHRAFQEYISKSKLNYEYLTYNNVDEQVALIITG